MAIQKKSLIGNLTATKKAIVATSVASNAPVSGSKLETAKKHPAAKGLPAAHLRSSKLGFAAKPLGPSAKVLGPSAKVLGPSAKVLGPSAKRIGPATKFIR